MGQATRKRARRIAREYVTPYVERRQFKRSFWTRVKCVILPGYRRRLEARERELRARMQKKLMKETTKDMVTVKRIRRRKR